MIKRLAKLKNNLIMKQRERINYNKKDHRRITLKTYLTKRAEFLRFQN
jgi:hypothetical protein